MHIRPKDLVAWLRDRVAEAGADGLTVALSGSIDSGVVARLCQLAMPERTVGVLLPSHTDSAAEEDARLIAQHFKLRVITVNVDTTIERLATDLQEELTREGATPGTIGGPDFRAGHARGNLGPRLWMTALYFVADTLNYLVAGTANRSQLTVGSFTKHGDSGVDLLPLGNALKSEVLALARDLDLPAALLDATRATALWTEQADENEMGFTYADLERYLEDGPDAVAPAVALKVERLMRTSEHKRALPPIPTAE